jgi:hypothetical protein
MNDCAAAPALVAEGACGRPLQRPFWRRWAKQSR